MPPAEGFVDIHSHVLYGMDDGAQTIEESVAMLEIAARSGTTDIVATPHANSQYPFDPALIDQCLAELGGRTTVRLHRGCDFHLQVDNIEDALAHPEKYTINQKGYLLVEFPSHSVFHGSEEILQRLLDAGMVPIVSHPERNAALQRQGDDLARWVELGCCVQVTAASFTGLFGPSARASARQFMERGLVHFVASDAHDTKHRTPDLREAYGRLADKWGEERIRPLFVENPRAVLTGDAVELDLPAGAPKRRRWYQFWG